MKTFFDNPANCPEISHMNLLLREYGYATKIVDASLSLLDLATLWRTAHLPGDKERDDLLSDAVAMMRHYQCLLLAEVKESLRMFLDGVTPSEDVLRTFAETCMAEQRAQTASTKRRANDES
jgi:hypothetical protein